MLSKRRAQLDDLGCRSWIGSSFTTDGKYFGSASRRNLCRIKTKPLTIMENLRQAGVLISTDWDPGEISHFCSVSKVCYKLPERSRFGADPH